MVPLKSALINKEPIDLAAAIGGDGTFIRAAGWIRGNSAIPLVGFNSDPEGSHGELCSILPSQARVVKWAEKSNCVNCDPTFKIKLRLRKVAKNCDFFILNLKITQKPEFCNEWI